MECDFCWLGRAWNGSLGGHDWMVCVSGETTAAISFVRW